MADSRDRPVDPTSLSHMNFGLIPDNGDPPETESSMDEELSYKDYQDGMDLLMKMKDEIEQKDIEEASATLQTFVNRKFCIQYFKFDYESNETILHHATKYDAGKMVSNILDKFPELVFEEKRKMEYEGQTALHISITRANKNVLELILRTAQKCDEESASKPNTNGKTLTTLLETSAIGTKFEGTVMMGEVPLFVAALKFDFAMVEKLIEYGAKIWTTNHSGDTIFHSLIKYLSRKRENEEDVKQMLVHLNDLLRAETKKCKDHEEKEDIRRLENDENPYERETSASTFKIKNYMHLWLMKDKHGLTPLKLAAKYQLAHIFEFILELKDVYCFQNEDEGLFDIKKYDITEVDSIANYHAETKEAEEEEEDDDENACCRLKFPQNESVLEMMFDKNYTRKFSAIIIEMTPVKKLIQKKWKKIVPLYTLWMFIQVALMICLSAYAVERSYWHEAEVDDNHGANTGDYFLNNKSVQMFLLSFQWVVFVIAIVYVVIVIVCVVAKLCRPNFKRYYMHNLDYLLLMLVFALALIVDILMTQAVGRHDGIPLIIALFSGWWFNVFFLRGWHLFSFFTVMIKEVIFGDFLRFSVIIAFQLFAFTTCMHTMFQGEGIPAIDGTNDNHYGTTLIAMFSLMVGLGELEFLFEARVPWLALTLFIFFVLLTYVLLLNALIAMMSSTCENVLDEKYSVWRIQQLSIILFIEDLFLVFCTRPFINTPGKTRDQELYNPIKDEISSTTRVRYMLDMKSRKRTFTEEETDVMRKRTQEEIKKTVNNKLKQTMDDSIAGQKKSEKVKLLQNDFLTRTDIEGPKLMNYTGQYEEELPKPPQDLSKNAVVKTWMEKNIR